MTADQVNTTFRVLTVDDNPTNLKLLLQVLEARGHKVMVATEGAAALKIAKQANPDLVLLDVVMPEMDGFEVCRRLKAEPETAAIPVIFLTGRDEKEAVIAGFQAGGVDYVVKPFREEEVLARVTAHIQLRRLHLALEEKNRELESEISMRKSLRGQLSMISRREEERWGLEGLIGDSSTMRKIFAEVELMQENPTTSVLITGESGTGKELIARAIHYGSERRDGPFVPVNCGAIPTDLVESVLFGHRRGAFTGASEDRIGYFEMAHGGTLFLDEIGDMPPALQTKLLRVLEDGEVWPVGATASRHVDVRILAATNVDFQNWIQEGSFRRDLYYRLARYTVETPPLRKRRDDIGLLANHFARLFAEEMGCDLPDLSAEAVGRLETYDFPGNVRELKNVVERAVIESRGKGIEVHHLNFPVAPKGGAADTETRISTEDELPLDLDAAALQAESKVLEKAMAHCDGNLTKAAELLGTSRNRLYRVLRSVQGEAPDADGAAQHPG